MSKKIGIVGLGHVGLPAAEAYIKAGYEVYGYARRQEVIDKFTGFGGIHVGSPAEVARNTQSLIVLVLNDPQVFEVVTGKNGYLEGIQKDAVIVGMSTINKQNVIKVAEACHEKGINFVDCPFTGGPPRVPKGTLTLIMAGPSQLVDRVRPFMEVIGDINHVGEEIGKGQAVKHCNQLLVASTQAATMEVLTLAEKLNLDLHQVSDIIGNGIAGSDWFRLLTGYILDNKPSPGGLGQMCKDINLVVNTGRENHIPLYVATAASQYFLSAEALDMKDRETAELIEVVKRLSTKNT